MTPTEVAALSDAELAIKGREAAERLVLATVVVREANDEFNQLFGEHSARIAARSTVSSKLDLV